MPHDHAFLCAQFRAQRSKCIMRPSLPSISGTSGRKRMRLGKLATVIACLSTLMASTAGVAQNTLKIGVITSLTGSQAAFGEAHKNGYAIALDEINAKGGVLGKKVELDFYDDQSKPDQAVQGVSKLVDQDHVAVLLGAYSSENTKAIINPVITRRIPLMIPTAGFSDPRWSQGLCQCHYRVLKT